MGVEVIIGLIGGGILLLLGLLRSKKKEGAAEARAEVKAEAQHQVDSVAVEQSGAEVKQVEEVREIHDRLEHDPTYADSVRDRFTRD